MDLARNVVKLRRNKLKFNSSQIILQAMALAGVLWYVVFCYVPMYGLTMSFQNFNFMRGILGSPFVGLKYFMELVTDPSIPSILANTLSIAVLKLLLCFPVTILFAVLLNEISSRSFKRLVQTASYFPYFISWIIVSMVAIYFFSPEYGFVNNILMSLHLVDKPITPLTDSGTAYWLFVFTQMWKDTGWSAIIFIAAISGIDPQIYEAAVVDGASKLQRIRYITLPSISGTIIFMLLMNLGNLFSGGSGTFDQSMFLGNAMNSDKSMVLSYYTLRMGIQMGRYSFGAAVGLLNGIVSLGMLIISNSLCKRFFGRGLYSSEGETTK